MLLFGISVAIRFIFKDGVSLVRSKVKTRLPEEKNVQDNSMHNANIIARRMGMTACVPMVCVRKLTTGVHDNASMKRKRGLVME